MDEKRDQQYLFVGLGELIWDLLPDGKRLGGAPTNFAYLARLLGNSAAVATRVGDDDMGREARNVLLCAGVLTDYLQVDPDHPTGTVGVEIDARGEAHFKVNENSAWDYLELSPTWEELAATADVICFGTLGQRKPQARETVNRFLELSRPEALRLFDVNLRHSFFTKEMLSRSLAAATVVKLNSAELTTAARILDLHASDETTLCRQIITRYGIELVAITKGAQGSLLITDSEEVKHSGYRVRVADTIGCGDAFAAALAHCRVRHATLDESSEAANSLGAWVATCTGATPEADASTAERMLQIRLRC
ncbi:MAG: fructokinase [Acidobacteriota bacterium]|nr:fructokinase [Acidobacteriota bacterium]